MKQTAMSIEDRGLLPFVDGSGREVRRIRSAIYGELWAPDNYAQLGVILEFVASQVDALGWRGQADIRWRLDSTAVRRLLNAHIDVRTLTTSDDVFLELDRHSPELGATVEEYERILVDHARLAGHDRLEGHRLSDFELLATLQHHGAATRFLDFTRSLFIALWFASTPFDENWGIVLGVRRMSGGPVEIAASDVQHLSTDAVLNKYSGRLVVWRPAPLVPRIAAQQSVLVCSPVSDHQWGSFGISFPSDTSESERVVAGRLGSVGKDMVAFAVSPELKHALRQGGRDLLGYDAGTMFPDLDGFSRWHAATATLDPELHRRLSGF